MDISAPPGTDSLPTADMSHTALDARTMAGMRTRLAAERTMMAWIRTGLSLISFGFTIYKFFQIQDLTARPFAQGLIGPRSFGFIMIATGLLAVLTAGIQNRRENRHLREAGFHVPHSMAIVVGALVFLLGLAGMAAVILHK